MTPLRMTLLTTSALVCAAIAPAVAQGQTATPAAQGSDPQINPNTAINPAPGEAEPTAPGDILVTARRRDESIVDVPLAITVVSSAQLEKLDITSTEQLANFTPGLQFSDFTPGNSRNDRGGNRPLIFRGLNLSNNGGVTGAGSMFLDGAAVIGNEIPAGMDIGAVEVLRGPQNVYFGRASMTGAVSYRTKAIPDHWTEGFDLTVAERATYRAEASIAGPLVPGVIGVRVTGLTEGNDGYVTNAFDRAKDLGARSRKSISGTLDFTPASALEVKLYANYFHDEDGMPATVNIFPDATITNGTVTSLGTVTNCVRGIAVGTGASQQARPTICGRVPGPQNAISYSNTVIPPREAGALFSIPFLKGEGFDNQPGLQRNAFNSHGVVNFRLSDYLKFQAITGYHTNAVQQVGDGIQQPVQPTATYAGYFYNLANKFSDFSQEARLSSDPDKPFSWTVGGNYVNARNQSSAVVTFQNQTNGVLTNYLPFPQNLGDDRAKTYGAFGGAYLKLFDKALTLSAEGRYQIDKRRTITRSAAGVLLSDVDGDFKSFNPRVSIDYDVGGHRKVYASFARGSRPGGFNAGLLVYYDPSNPIYTRTTPAPLNLATVAQSITDTFGVTDPTYAEETLSIGELGFKGNVLDGRGYFDINAYYGKVKNQQLRKSLVVPALGFALGAVTNAGEVEIYGVEWTGNFDFTRAISIATTFAWNHTNRTRYSDPSPATLQLYGAAYPGGDFSGLELPNTPEYSGSAVLSYEPAPSPEFAPYGNVAVVYRGRQWADIGNLAYIPGRTTVDVRVGVGNETLKVEGFVTNAFNNKTYPGGNVAPDFGGNPRGQYSGFFGAYAVPRTVGLRVSSRF